MRNVHLVLSSAFLLTLALSACPPGEQGTTPDCAAYCASVTANCSGGAAQYESEAACVEFCNANNLTWGTGTTADAAGNTLGCRQYHAGAAANDDHCLHAGPTGGSVCGTYCDVYCDAAMGNCTDANAQYGDRDSCLAACAIIPAGGEVNTPSGDSVQCRLFHLGAAKGDPAGHCAASGATGANACGTWCNVYCDVMDEVCPDEYTGAADCDSACGEFGDDGAINDAEGDTVQCRLYHAGAAAADNSHCAHAGADSTADTCGAGVQTATCASYCATISANCTGGSEQYGSEAECLDFCEANAVHWTEGTDVADSGDHSLGCREWHAIGANNDAHCVHAGPTGGGVCGDLCETYCHAMDTYCNGSYADYDTCLTACAAFAPDGNVNAATGDTVQCRIYHAGFAWDDNTHCDHADEDSAAGQCQ
ncbi:MAG: hypothetical protein A2138_20810 [Deltaproteobacteria bacterium RBG_16_71_12]|nr:MAG: hypothetical protein A2138_20810 [Deltaproteobacteria bacterium RBG_16_71_12]